MDFDLFNPYPDQAYESSGTVNKISKYKWMGKLLEIILFMITFQKRKFNIYFIGSRKSKIITEFWNIQKNHQHKSYQAQTLILLI